MIKRRLTIKKTNDRKNFLYIFKLKEKCFRGINMKVVMEIPDELKLGEKEIKIAALTKLYELGRISSGKAARLLGISRVEFLDLLGKYNVHIEPDTEEELSEEIKNA